MEETFLGSIHPQKFTTHKNLMYTKILTPQNQNGRGRGNFRGSASTHHETREYLRSISPGSGKLQNKSRSFDTVGFMCL